MPRTTDLDLDLEERRRLLDDWLEKRRQIAVLEAEAYGLLVERIAVHDADVSDSPHHRDSIYRSMIAEYSAAGHLTTGSVEYGFTDARTLHRTMPTARAAFEAGAITARHVREIVRAGEIVDDAVRAGRVEPDTMNLYETAAVVIAEQDTVARTGIRARKAAAALVGLTVVEKQRKATDERSVTVRSVDDGLAVLTAILPEWVAVAIHDRLTRMARQVARTRDEREPVLEPTDAPEGSRHLDDFSPEDPRYDAYFEGGIIVGEDGTFTTDPFTTPVDPMTDPTSPDIEHLAGDQRTFDQIRADLSHRSAARCRPERGQRLGTRERLCPHPGDGRSQHPHRRRRSARRARRPRPARSRGRPTTGRLQRRMDSALPHTDRPRARDRLLHPVGVDAPVSACSRSALSLPRVQNAGASL